MKPNGWIICETAQSGDYHAGTKARADAESIACAMGMKRYKVLFDDVNRKNAKLSAKIKYQFTAFSQWQKGLNQLSTDSTAIIQYPLENRTVFFPFAIKRLKRRGTQLIVLIHDIDSLRYRHSIKLLPKRLNSLIQDRAMMRLADRVIVHNTRMLSVLLKENIIHLEQAVILGMFDYLTTGSPLETSKHKLGEAIVIAGNLMPEKAGYVYDLPQDIRFRLYGPNYEDNGKQANIEYMGSFPPDDLPFNIVGSFGLVWDGDSATTCSGAYGDYLRYNNPHKLSLYLAAGLPVVVWSESAVSEFVKQSNVGICINSLLELEDMIKRVSQVEYEEMLKKVRKYQSRACSGQYLHEAINRCLGL